MDDFVVTVRPSGTEPKLKFYCQLAPRGRSSRRGMDLLAEVSGRAESLARQVYGELLSRLDLELGPAGLLIPDIVDVDRKREFEQTVQPQLHSELAGSGMGSLKELLDWLRGQASGMTPERTRCPLSRLPSPVSAMNGKPSWEPHPSSANWIGGHAGEPCSLRGLKPTGTRNRALPWTTPCASGLSA